MPVSQFLRDVEKTRAIQLELDYFTSMFPNLAQVFQALIDDFQERQSCHKVAKFKTFKRCGKRGKLESEDD